MKETTLLKIALICSLLGLLILYLISDNTEIKEKNIEKITLDNKDEFVKLKGIVNNVVDTEKVVIMEITQPQQMIVVLFKDENKTMPIQQGNEVEVIGKVDEYEGKLEIIADRLRVVR
jgi:DNA/RNA endonuclease YhcR with UshA esterase domain